LALIFGLDDLVAGFFFRLRQGLGLFDLIFGVVFGAVMGNVGLGIALGLPIGVALGFVFGGYVKKDESEEDK